MLWHSTSYNNMTKLCTIICIVEPYKAKKGALDNPLCGYWFLNSMASYCKVSIGIAGLPCIACHTRPSGKSWVPWALLNLFEPHLNSLNLAWACLAKCFLSKTSSYSNVGFLSLLEYCLPHLSEAWDTLQDCLSLLNQKNFKDKLLNDSRRVQVVQVYLSLMSETHTNIIVELYRTPSSPPYSLITNITPHQLHSLIAHSPWCPWKLSWSPCTEGTSLIADLYTNEYTLILQGQSSRKGGQG